MQFLDIAAYIYVTVIYLNPIYSFYFIIKSFEQDLLDLLKSADGGNEESIEKLNLIKLTDLHKAVIHKNYDQVFIRLFIIRSK